MADLEGFDNFYWELDADGALTPRETPVAAVWPALGDVREDVAFGPDSAYLGTFGSGDAATAGSLSLASFDTDTAILNYVAGDNFDNGTLRIIDRRTARIRTQALVVGRNTVTGLTASTSYLFTADIYNVDDVYGAMAGPVFMTTADAALDLSGNLLEIEWKSERTDWQTYLVGDGAKRVRVPSNCRGFHLRKRVTAQGQNSRITLKALKLHVRKQGAGETAHG
jgi:hypothetical protein